MSQAVHTLEVHHCTIGHTLQVNLQGINIWAISIQTQPIKQYANEPRKAFFTLRLRKCTLSYGCGGRLYVLFLTLQLRIVVGYYHKVHKPSPHDSAACQSSPFQERSTHTVVYTAVYSHYHLNHVLKRASKMAMASLISICRSYCLR